MSGREMRTNSDTIQRLQRSLTVYARSSERASEPRARIRAQATGRDLTQADEGNRLVFAPGFQNRANPGALATQPAPRGPGDLTRIQEERGSPICMPPE